MEISYWEDPDEGVAIEDNVSNTILGGKGFYPQLVDHVLVVHDVDDVVDGVGVDTFVNRPLDEIVNLSLGSVADLGSLMAIAA